MRLKTLIAGEFLLLYKNGICFLYAVFTALYLCLIAALPNTAREISSTILVFTDPAAMGLFFMGAIVLFEKSQRIESSLAVSPITIPEYIIAKVFPIMTVGIVASLIICLFSGTRNIILTLIGVALSSVLFSLCGLQIAANIKSLNSFMLATVPFEIIIFVPALLFLFGVIKSSVWPILPGVAAIKLIQGESDFWYLTVLSLVLWILLAYYSCKKAVAKSFCTMGGAKL